MFADNEMQGLRKEKDTCNEVNRERKLSERSKCAPQLPNGAIDKITRNDNNVWRGPNCATNLV